MSREDLIQQIVENMARCQRPANFSAWQKIGLSRSQAGMLFMLSHHKRLQVNQIADHLGISTSAASQMLDPLSLKGLVTRQLDIKDRRIAYFELTLKGQTALKKLHRLKFAGLRSRLDNLSAAELESLSKLTAKLSANKDS